MRFEVRWPPVNVATERNTNSHIRVHCCRQRRLFAKSPNDAPVCTSRVVFGRARSVCHRPWFRCWHKRSKWKSRSLHQKHGKLHLDISIPWISGVFGAISPSKVMCVLEALRDAECEFGVPRTSARDSALVIEFFFLNYYVPFINENLVL